jgi:hypothetical protein
VHWRAANPVRSFSATRPGATGIAAFTDLIALVRAVANARA